MLKQPQFTQIALLEAWSGNKDKQLSAWKGFHQGHHDWGMWRSVTWKATSLLLFWDKWKAPEPIFTQFHFSFHKNHAYKEYKI